MSTNIECYEDANEEEFDINKENEKISENLFTGLGLVKKEDEEETKPNEQKEDILSVFKTYYNKLQNDKQKQNTKQPTSNKKHPFYRIGELQKELETISKEIVDYIQLYNDNTILKETEKFDDVLKELEIYSSKLKELMNSELYKNSVNKSSDSKALEKIKNDIKNNLENYTASTTKLMNIISNEKITLSNQADNKSYIHEIITNKTLIDENLQIDNEINQIEEQLKKLESIVGENSKKTNSGDDSDKTGGNNIINTLHELTKFTEEKIIKNKLNKEKSLTYLNSLLDNFLNEKNTGTEISEFFIKIKELYAIFELYETYGDIFVYIKKRLKAIKKIHENSVGFKATIEDLKDMIKDNERKFESLSKKYNETFNEFDSLEDVLKQFKFVEQFLNNYLVE